MTTGQKAMRAARTMNVNKGMVTNVALAERAAKMRVGATSIYRACMLLKNGSAAMIAAVEEGRVSLNQAHDETRNNIKVPTVMIRRTARRCSDERKIEGAIDTIATVSGYLVRFSGHAVKSEWSKSISESRRNLQRFRRGGSLEEDKREVSIEDAEHKDPRSAPSPESAA